MLVGRSSNMLATVHLVQDISYAATAPLQQDFEAQDDKPPGLVLVGL